MSCSGEGAANAEKEGETLGGSKVGSAARDSVLRAARSLLGDMLPRTARQIAAELGQRGVIVDKSLVSSVLSLEGRKEFEYDRATYLYCIVSAAKFEARIAPALSEGSASKIDTRSTNSPIEDAPTRAAAATRYQGQQGEDGEVTALGLPENAAPSSRYTNAKPAVSLGQSGFGAYVYQFRSALADEIGAVRANGGQKCFVTDGRYIGTRNGWYIYTFTADTELRFPDDTPVDIEHKGVKHPGIIASIDGFDIMIGIDAYIGEQVANAILLTAPWFLLEQLRDRLLELANDPTANTVLAERLLTPSQPNLGQPQIVARAANAIQQPSLSKQAPPQGLLKTAAIMWKELNQHQQAAIKQLLSSEVTYVWGPPGTGKTKTLGFAVASLLAKGESVLVLAHSNAAVDVAMTSVATHVADTPEYKAGKVVRYGGVGNASTYGEFQQLHVRGVARQQQPDLVAHIEELERQRVELMRRARSREPQTGQASIGVSIGGIGGISAELDSIKRFLAPLKEELREFERELVRRATVVGCTFSKSAIAPEIYNRRFSAVIVDEASMAYIPHCAFGAALAANRIGVFGDFRQLAPISVSESANAKRWLQRDVFEQAGIVQKVEKHQWDARLALLKIQYRMHPEIAGVPNRLFYANQLENGPNNKEQSEPISAIPPGMGKPLVLIDLSKLGARCYSEPQSHSRFNVVSAIFAAHYAISIADRSPYSVGIITPYNAQSRLVHRLLRDMQQEEKHRAAKEDRPVHTYDERIKVATVHRFQGSEKDVIIFDTVEGPPKTKPGKLLVGGKGSGAMRLANVAVSRARGKFVGLIDFPFLRENLDAIDTFRGLLADISAHTTPQPAAWPMPKAPAGWESNLSASLNTNLNANMHHLPGISVYAGAAAAKAAVEADIGSTKEELAICWPTKFTGEHFSLQLLKSYNPERTRLFLTVKQGHDEWYTGLKNTHVWEVGARQVPGLLGIDKQRLWVFVDPQSKFAPVLRIDLPNTTKLLYAFWRLVPEEEAKRTTIHEKVAAGKSPLGKPCPRCGGAMWLSEGHFGRHYLACTAEACGYRKFLTPSDATELAQLMGVCCGACGQQVRGRSSAGGVFLGCTNYPRCKWTKSLELLL